MSTYSFPQTPSAGETWTHPETRCIYRFENGRWKANSRNFVNDIYVNQTGDSMSGELILESLSGTGSSLVSVNADGMLVRGGSGVDDSEAPYAMKSGDFFNGNIELGTSSENIKIRLNNITGVASFVGNVEILATPLLGTHAITLDYFNAVVASLDSSYFSLGGGNIAGDVTISSNSILLGSNGTASFSGNINAAEGNFSKALTVQATSGSDIILQSYLNGQDTFKLRADGSMDIRNIVAMDAGIDITDDNQITPKKYVDDEISSKIADQALISEDLFVSSSGDNISGNLTIDFTKIQLNTDGTANFTNRVTADSFTGDGAELTNIHGKAYVQLIAPNSENLDPGTLWWCTKSDSATLYVLYYDPAGPFGGQGGKRWVEASPMPDWFKGFHTGDSYFNGHMEVDGGATFAYGNLTIADNGNVENANNSYGGISDQKLKIDVRDAKSQWKDIKDIRLVNYKFKPGLKLPKGEQLGVISQELKQISPGLISEKEDYETKLTPMFNSLGEPVLELDGNQKMKEVTRKTGTKTESVKYSVLYLKAIGALQECMERIENLESELKTLKGQ